MTIYGYTRVSSEEQIDGTSLETQRTMSVGVAMANELPTDNIEWLEDAAVSGGSAFFKRPAVATVELRQGDVIICAALDRFSRDARDCLNAIHQLQQLGPALFLNGHGDVTSEQNVTGRLMLEVMAAFAGHERRLIGARTTRGRRAKRRSGGFVGGTAQFGYRVEGEGKAARLVAEPWRKAAMADMRRWKDSGKSLRAIAALISERYASTSHMAVKRALDGRAPGKPLS